MKAIRNGIAAVMLLVFGVEITIFVISGNSFTALEEFNAGMASAMHELLTFFNPFVGTWEMTAAAAVVLGIIVWCAIVFFAISQEDDQLARNNKYPLD